MTAPNSKRPIFLGTVIKNEHISKILYVTLDATDTNVSWDVKMTVIETSTTFLFKFEYVGNEVEMQQTLTSTSKKTFRFPRSGEDIDVYSFAPFSFRGKSGEIMVAIGRNGKALHKTEKHPGSVKALAETVSYWVTVLPSTKEITVNTSIANIHGGKDRVLCTMS